MHDAELREVKSKIDELIENKFIHSISSLWDVPVLFATKKDGSLRLCIDYRAFNKLTIKNSYPQTRIYKFLDRYPTAKYFSKIDLQWGYYQVLVDDKSVPLTAFRTRYGAFEFVVMPFGLANAPSVFIEIFTRLSGINTGNALQIAHCKAPKF